jgi:hypothetical protein
MRARDPVVARLERLFERLERENVALERLVDAGLPLGQVDARLVDAAQLLRRREPVGARRKETTAT